VTGCGVSNFLSHAFDGVRRRAQDAARLALPQRCQLCASASGSALICAGCEAGLPRAVAACPICALPSPPAAPCGACLAHPPPYDATIAAYNYAFPVDRLVQAFKYHGRLALADWCAEAIVERSRHEAAPAPPTVIVAMPLASERQRERGFNQAAEIARVVSARTGIALLRSGVHRVRACAPQAALPWADRVHNVRDAFACDLGLAGVRVAAIDDVMTTGATLAEFARTLKAAGAQHVQNWVVARTLLPAG
jgi:ComF family protein